MTVKEQYAACYRQCRLQASGYDVSVSGDMTIVMNAYKSFPYRKSGYVPVNPTNWRLYQLLKTARA